ncbi:hypothetical protein XTGART2_2094 [Xanthomonas translucens pv. graminis]|jgi:hypothetical protein|uniref:Uncharacterized protein n=1 Tax=Xanthomonas graminis pv. graminis TaxID=134874 RepID=A0A1M4JIN2_9XANT|nr:putative peptide [Xanthomonas translucens pv. graminis ART-Xtg29]SBV42279.1 hypothetical protein XTGART2_2094 [Xanthomonas translucens pv. graminis]SBV42956.1 hypothetical protein XTGART9_2095 [Xanthomonas translucens pv. graminis]SBV47485.1 hypothetical protein XTGART29_2127 [Xanthomonas translucens pv. graminis ART-Xtg29]SBV55464.1 hypothetical protein XTGART10_2101 [Xanthomonas translucens pv. graminis]
MRFYRILLKPKQALAYTTQSDVISSPPNGKDS